MRRTALEGAEREHERRIAAALEEAVGVSAAVIVMTARVLAAIVDENPLRIDQADASRCECEVAKTPLGPVRGGVTTRNWATTCTLRAAMGRCAPHE